jgi:putative component of toxin-antitoxin plasmid stabilization module
LNTLLRSSDFDAWLSHLADQKAKARILARLGSATSSQTKDIAKAKKMARELKRAKP